MRSHIVDTSSNTSAEPPSLFPLTEQLPVVFELLGLSLDRGLGHHQSLSQLFALLLQMNRLLTA